METNLILSSSPHIHTRDSSRRIMLDVIIALLPAAIAGVIIFGAKALGVIAACVITAVVSEALFNLIVHKQHAQLFHSVSSSCMGSSRWAVSPPVSFSV